MFRAALDDPEDPYSALVTAVKSLLTVGRDPVDMARTLHAIQLDLFEYEESAILAVLDRLWGWCRPEDRLLSMEEMTRLHSATWD